MTSAAKKDNGGDEKVFADELAPGTELLNGAYVIERFLNSGGFGITYLAKDSLDRSVVIKECFPGSFCRRSNTIVGARSRAHQNEFRSIVKLFVQEARSLSKLKHPNIVGVHQVFEDNDTAYMALDYIEGNDLLDILEDPQRELATKEIQTIMSKVLDAVSFIHNKGVLHRDISPDNILIDQDTNPVLIDFGAAREEATKASRVLSALRVVKDGYSPQEFYIQGSEQTPSSDLYALGASFYHLITGDTPPNSQNRLAAIAAGDKDPYIPLHGRIRGYEEGFLPAIDKALSVFPKDRLQSADDWLAMIDKKARETAAFAEAESDDVVNTVVELVSKNSEIEPKMPGLEAQVAKVKPKKPVAVELVPEPQEEQPQVEVRPDPIPTTAETVAKASPLVVEPTPAPTPAPAPARTPAPAAAAKAAPVPDDEPRSKLGLLLGSAAAIAIIAAIAATQFGGENVSDAPDEVPAAVETGNADLAPADTAVADTPTVETPQIETAGTVDAPATADAEPDNSAVNALVSPSLETEPDVSSVLPEVADVEAAPSVDAIETIEEPTVAADAETGSTDTPELAALSETTEAGQTEEPVVDSQSAELPVEATAEPVFDETPPELVTSVVRPIERPTNGGAIELNAIANDTEVSRGDLSVLNPATSVEDADAALAGIDTSPAAPTPDSVFVEEPSVLELSSVMSGWQASIPFGSSDPSSLVVETVGPEVSSWLQPGYEIVRVNGLGITSMDQVEKVVRSTTDLTDEAVVEADIVFRKEAGGPLFQETVELEVVREIALLNGTRFQVRQIDGAWKTIATNGSGTSEASILVGDEIVSYIRSNQLIDGPTTLLDLLKSELEAGQTSFNFAVLRDGTTWLASLSYEAGNAD